jgi:hypothetical protein
VSGRPKPGRPDEAEQLRQLIREAHEAAQELRAAVKDTRAVIQGDLAGLMTSVHQEYNDKIQVQAADCAETLRAAAGQLQATWEREQEQRFRDWNDMLGRLRVLVTALARRSPAAAAGFLEGAPMVAVTPPETGQADPVIPGRDAGRRP